jgi:hypothetical protein
MTNEEMPRIECTSASQLHKIADAVGAKIYYAQDAKRLYIPCVEDKYPTFWFQVV